ncbi:MAG TPA: TetR family transcriptional regulator [Myxococcaceae bacterium]|nr:TetR family transcriptional regulator [Myxococcaceae bacterium]
MRSVSHIVALAFLAGSSAALALPAAEARAQVQKARDAAQALQQQQSRLKTELNEVAGRIQELKAQQRGRLIPGGELPGLLRRSQELSGSLTDVEANLSRAEGEVLQKRGALAEALGAEMDAARAAFDKAGRDERRSLLERMRALRQERDQVRAQLPAAGLPQVKAEASDDPADLLEQADALRDTQDKVTARLKALEKRIAEVKRERELDRRMGEFVGEEQAFDERDRRLATSPTAGDGTRDGRLPNTEHTEPVFGATGPTFQSFQPRSPGKDGQPQVGVGGATGPADGDDLAALLRQQKELEAMSKELGARADELERRAR